MTNYSYIIVRVEEDGRCEHSTNAGHIRKSIHAASGGLGINVADNVIRWDRKSLPRMNFSDPIQRVPYAEAESLFRAVMPHREVNHD